MADYEQPKSSGCPMGPNGGGEVKARSLLGRTNKDWWPDALPIDMLHQHGVSPTRWAKSSTMPSRSSSSTMPH